MNWTGLIIAGLTLCSIGLGFLWVIKLEYHLGAKVAWPVGLLGGAVVLGALFASSFWAAAVLGVVGGTIVWGATELPDQAERVERGLFKKNPKRGGAR